MRFTESDNIELKSMVVSDICKEVVAFANTEGGTLYIGVNDDGSIAGVDDADHTTLQLSNKIRDSIKPDVTMFVRYETQTLENKQIIAVTIQKGTDRPYYLSNKGLKPSGVYVRNGSSSDPATDTAIRQMIKETDGDSFESMRALNQNLTFHSAEQFFFKRSVEFTPAKMQTLGMLSPDGIFSNVGLLLSDQCKSTVKAATFEGTTQSIFQDRREFEGSLFQQMEELYSYLDMRNQTKATFDGLYRKDSRDYPEEALREALMNCLVHRDYSFSASTLVSIYSDRMEFISVGGLPAGISLEDIMLGLSICRNPKLASIFYRLELIEAYGTGIPKIMNAYAGTQRKPKVDVSPNAFKITLPNRNVSALTFADSATYSASSTSENSEEYRILQFAEANGSIVRSDVETLLNVSQSTANRTLNQMVREGLICREGSGKRTQYRKK